jgi:hypothetical protein
MARPIHLAALTSCVLLLDLAPRAMAQAPAQALAGGWYAETRTADGVGILFEFTSGGKFNYTLGAIKENRYRFEGDKLTITFLDPQKGAQPAQVFTASITGGKLTMGSAAQPMAVYNRSGQPEDGPNSIVGAWTKVQELNGNRVINNWRFRNDGTAVFTVPFGWRSGVYTVTGDQIRLTLDGKPPVDGPWRWEGAVLILPAAKGPSKFHRL